MASSQLGPIIFLFLYVANDAVSQPLSPEQEQGLRDFVSATMSCRKNAGLTLALVRNDETVFSEGFGLRDVGNNLPMEPSTRINIGSETKSFTSSLCAHAVSRGLVTWDEPLRDVLGPDFGLEGPFRTAQVYLRDALAHKIGMPNYWGLSTAGMNVTREELCTERLKYFPTKYNFRSRYIYSNYPYVLAGYVQEVVTNQTWDDYLKGVLLDPLEMNNTRTASQLTEVDWQQTAYSYIVENGSFIENPEKEQLPFLEEISPAGGIFSTADDMAKWLNFHIRKGKTESGQIIIPSEIMTEMYTPTFSTVRESPKIQKPAFPVESTQITTGMGWFQGMYRGYEKVVHSGSYSSYSCLMTILPEVYVGVWACVNSPGDYQSVAAVETVNMFSLDLLLDQSPWLNTTTTCTYPDPWQDHVTTESESGADVHLRRLSGLRSNNSSDVNNNNNNSNNTDDYVGDYYHPAFGTFYISDSSTRDRLVYKFGMLLSGDLQPSGTADVFYMTLDPPLHYRMTFFPQYPEGFPVYFERDAHNGTVVSVEVPYFEFNLPPIFDKQ